MLRKRENQSVSIKNIFYIWISKKDNFNPARDYCPIFNSESRYFLQAAIAHSSTHRTIHIVQYNPYKGSTEGNNIDAAFNQFANDYKDHGLNIKIHDASELIKDDLIFSRLISHPSLSFASQIDLLKIFVGASLHKFNCNEGFIADFDCVIPEDLVIDFSRFSVIPLIDPEQNWAEFDCMGIMDHYIENGCSAVQGKNNFVFKNMLNSAKEKENSYFTQHENDAVYRIYVAEVLRQINPLAYQELDIKDLFQKFLYPNPLRTERASELFQLENKIEYDRGGSWIYNYANKINSIRPIFKPGCFPIFQRELNALKKWALFSRKKDELVHLIEPLIQKGFNVNSRIIRWNNTLQKESSLLPEFIDRSSDEESLDEQLDIFKYLIDKGALIDDDVLICLLEKNNNDFSRRALALIDERYAEHTSKNKKNFTNFFQIKRSYSEPHLISHETLCEGRRSRSAVLNF